MVRVLNTPQHLLRLDLPSGLFPSGLSHPNPICTSSVSHTCHMPCPSPCVSFSTPLLPRPSQAQISSSAACIPGMKQISYFLILSLIDLRSDHICNLKCQYLEWKAFEEYVTNLILTRNMISLIVHFEKCFPRSTPEFSPIRKNICFSPEGFRFPGLWR